MKAAVKERPILFSAPMVNAILAGTKTMTRRIVKPQPKIHPRWGSTLGDPTSPAIDGVEFGHGTENWGIYSAALLPTYADEIARRFSPYGVPGDRLWVRETMRLRDPGKRTEVWTYSADGAEVSLPTGHPSITAMLSWAHHKESNTCVSIHMPRWASRIDLEVTAVRVERLQDITEKDVWAEGIEAVDGMLSDAEIAAAAKANGWTIEDARASFAVLWDEINGDKAPWKSNPWVWVVSFERVRP